MGDKSVAFVQKAHEYARQNAMLVPPFLDMDAMAVDLAAVQQLRELIQSLAPIDDALHDSFALSGSEAYQAALVFYTNIKAAAKSKAPGAAAIYDDLSIRFPGALPQEERFLHLELATVSGPQAVPGRRSR